MMRLAGLGMNGEIFLVVESASLSFAALSAMLTDAGYEELIELNEGQDYETHYFDGTNIVPRPVSSPPPALAASVDTIWTGLPPGAAVMVHDPANGVAGTDVADASGALTLRIEVTGLWLLSVADSFPWLGGEWAVEVAA